MRSLAAVDETGGARTLTRVRRTIHGVVLCLFFFNAVLDRLTLYYLGVALFTNLFYALLGLGIALECALMLRSAHANPRTIAAGIFLTIALIAGLAYGDPVASVYGIKQFFLGVVLLFLFANGGLQVSILVRCLLGVQLYAMFQGIYFWAQGFTLPPWDMVYVQSLLESWQARNLYQGELIRPFATFASFSEYQIVVHVFTVTLFVLRGRLDHTNRRLAWALMGVLLVVDVLLPDRTPILMAAITLATVCIGEYVVYAVSVRPRRILVGIALTAFIGAAIIVIPGWLLGSETSAWYRLGEGFRFWRAESVAERAATVWSEAIFTIRSQPEGAGPAAVVTGLYPDAFTPHSNYFLFAIAYSAAFPLVFLSFLAVAFRHLFLAAASRDLLRARVGFCAWGVTLAYLASSFFNASFSGYPGGAYFLLMLWLSSLIDDREAAPALSLGLPDPASSIAG